MSSEAHTYVKQLTHAPNGEPITAAEKAVLYPLSEKHNPHTGVAEFSLKLLAKESSCTVPGLVRILRRLERHKQVLQVIRTTEAKRGHVSNQYRFPALPDTTTSRRPTHPRTVGATHPGLVGGTHPRTVGATHPGLDASLRGEEKTTDKEKKESSIEPGQCVVVQGDGFARFWDRIPARNGKKLEKTETHRLFLLLSDSDQELAITAASNYANSELVKKGIGIRDPKRFLRDGKGQEIWRDWIEPEIVHQAPARSVLEYAAQGGKR